LILSRVYEQIVAAMRSRRPATTRSTLQGIPQHFVQTRTKCPIATMPPHVSAVPTSEPRPDLVNSP